jgi:hypothetical protein
VKEEYYWAITQMAWPFYICLIRVPVCCSYGFSWVPMYKRVQLTICILNIAHTCTKFYLLPIFLGGFKYCLSRWESAYQIQTKNIQNKIKEISGELDSNGVSKLTFSEKANNKIIIVLKF